MAEMMTIFAVVTTGAGRQLVNNSNRS